MEPGTRNSFSFREKFPQSSCQVTDLARLAITRLPTIIHCHATSRAFLFAFSAANVSVGGGGTIYARGRTGVESCPSDLAKPPCDGHARPQHVLNLQSARA